MGGDGEILRGNFWEVRRYFHLFMKGLQAKMSAMKCSPMFLNLLALPVFFILSGCASLPKGSPSVANAPLIINVGMTEDEVAQRMGTSKVIGYKMNSSTQSFDPMTITQPYRTEIMNIDGEHWKANYYFTRVKADDGQVTDDELEPILFRDGYMVGRGWPFLRDLKKSSSTNSAN